MKNIILFITFLTFVTNKVVCQIKFKINFNENLSEDSNFLILIDQSLQQCAEQCAERSKCKALRYRRRFRLCDLFTDYVPTPTQNDFITISRDDMQIPVTFNVCDVDDVNCVKKECSPPAAIANGRYLGNMNQIGSKKAILCDQGYVEVNNVRSVICETDGNWNYTPTCEVNQQSEQSSFAERTQFFTTSANHANAVAACAGIGAKLVKIDQRWKMDYIVNFIQNNQAYQSSEYWIDGSNADAADYSASDAWRFHDNTVMPMDSYFWDSGKPDNPASEHCVRITTGLRFNDRGCTVSFGYICEQ